MNLFPSNNKRRIKFQFYRLRKVLNSRYYKWVPKEYKENYLSLGRCGVLYKLCPVWVIENSLLEAGPVMDLDPGNRDAPFSLCKNFRVTQDRLGFLSLDKIAHLSPSFTDLNRLK